MSRESQAIVAQRRQLGAALATFRQAAEWSQAQVGTETDYDRTSINKIEHGHQLPDRPFWQAVDRLLQAQGALVKQYDDLVANKRSYAEGHRRSSRAHHQEDAQRLRRAGQPIVPASLRAADNDFAGSTAPRSYSAGVAAGGSQAPVVNSWVRTAKLSRPHLVAVDR
jgi:transcriptional regulator with XRE-family HTH domain